MRKLVLSALLLASAFQTAFGWGEGQSGDWCYSVSNNKATISCYMGSGGAVTIPSSVNGIPVVKVGDEGYPVLGFYNTSVTSVTIPNGVTTIGDAAFMGCNILTSVIIPNSVTSIGSYAFNDCPCLVSVNIPDSVNSIGDSAFRYCTSLTNINIPNSLNRIGNSMFDSCYSLVSVTVGSNVTSIGHYAFYSCRRLITVNIPDNVTSIGDYAFYSCEKISSINIPDNVTSIGANAFDGCTSLSGLSIGKGLASIGNRALYSCTSLSSITVDPSNPNYSSDVNGVLFNKNKTTLIQYPVGRTAYSYAIPESVTNIQSLAFHLCQNLVSITILNSLTSIGDQAFYSCVNLVNISMPNGVAAIGNYAFFACYQLTSITIPSVNWIGEYAFANCIRLTRAIFKGNAPSAYSSSFANTNTQILYYPETSGWGGGLADRPTIKVVVGPPSISLAMSYDGSEIMLFWKGTPNSVYAIQSTDRLSSPFITRSIITASGLSQVWDEPEPSSAVSRFYRIALVQP